MPWRSITILRVWLGQFRLPFWWWCPMVSWGFISSTCTTRHVRVWSIRIRGVSSFLVGMRHALCAIESPKFSHRDLAHCAPENGDWVPLWYDSKLIRGWKTIAGQYVERSKSLRGCEKGPRKRISAGSTSTPWFLDFLVNSSPCEVFFGQVDSMMF